MVRWCDMSVLPRRYIRAKVEDKRDAFLVKKCLMAWNMDHPKVVVSLTGGENNNNNIIIIL